MKRIAMLAGWIAASICARSQELKISEIFPIESSHSYIGFSIQYMGYAKVRGRFSDFNGSFRYVDKDLTKTSVSLQIDVKSLDTDSEWRDKDLLSPNWFGAEAFPKIEFISQKAEVTPQGVVVTGNLTMHGVTKSVAITLPDHSGLMKDMRGDSQVIFAGEFKLNRRDYGVEGKNWSAVKEGMTAVSDNVTIEVSILGKQINEGNFRNWLRNPKSAESKIYSETKANGAASGIKLFETLKAEAGSNITSTALNTAGYMLMKEGKVEDAIALAAKNVEAFPADGNVYDSYGEALASAGRWTEAKKNYELALEKDPNNMNAREVLKNLR